MKNTFVYLLAFFLVITLSGCQAATSVHTHQATAIVIIAVIILLFFALAFYSNILRDEISDCTEFDRNAAKIGQKLRSRFVDKSAPFSLTKVQFGAWTVIIASSYIYLSLTKGDCAAAPLNKTALVLMGIFAGTAVASTIMDKGEINDNRSRHQNSPSQGFFVDILSDDSGISLHRFQNFVWTIIAMSVYINKIFQITAGCILPELSDTLLALTGISSATYLVLKSQENDPATPSSAAPVVTVNAAPTNAPQPIAS